ncbi:MAG TPA: hypothetical protein VFZ10_17090 [Geminicoccaceae bacterium]
MTLTEALARDPPRTRRFRLLAPLLVLLCLALLAMLPGLLVHITADDQEPVPQSIDEFVTYQGR